MDSNLDIFFFPLFMQFESACGKVYRNIPPVKWKVDQTSTTQAFNKAENYTWGALRTITQMQN